MKDFLDFSYFRRDVLGGITAGVVALPLALAFGEQSGLGAAAGLYGAAFIAFFASLFGGTPTQISGPTAPITALSMVIIAGLLQTYEGRMEDALPVILAVFLLAGLLEVALGVLKLGTYIKFIPHPVVSGFMTGIGVIILITQILPAVGYYSGEDEQVIEAMKPHAEQLLLDRIIQEEAEDGLMVLEDIKETASRAQHINEGDIKLEAEMLAANDSKGVLGSLRYLSKALGRIDLIELLITLVTIVIIYGFTRITTSIPSTLVALVAVTGGALALGIDYAPIKEIPMGIPKFRADVITGFDIAEVLPFFLSALMLALLGAIDSLLTSVVADNMTRTRHDPNRELVGQGIGNSISALFAGLPGAGATIRTVVNIQAGGRTKLSGMTAGVLLFIIILFLGPIASKIPAAVLAGVLITVGIGVMDHHGLKELGRMSGSDRVILLTVLVLTVFWQLIYAVGVGIVMAALVFLKRMSDVSAHKVIVNDLRQLQAEDPLWPDEVDIPESIRDKVLFKHMHGPFFFGSVSEFRDIISELPEIHLFVIRMERIPFMDQSGIHALRMALTELHEQDVVVALSGPNEHVLGTMRKLRVVPQRVQERHVFKDFEACRDWLKDILKDEDGLEREIALIRQS